MPFPPLPRLRRLLVLLLLSGVLPPLSSPALARAASASADHAATTAAPPPVLLATNYDDSVDPVPYLVSEKLDGVRGLWDGRTLHFRSGRVIHAPAWFTAGLPPHPLDGELWMDRGRFEQTSAAVRREVPDDAEWHRISYQVFEWPGGRGSFSERYAALQASIEKAGTPWLKLRPQFRVASRQQLKARLAQVVAAGGEGLVLHRADARWQTGRTPALLKLKPQPDAEATVIGYVPGKGKYRGLCGALLVRGADGRRFRLGSGLSDAQRHAPPPLGTSVTFRYRGRTRTGLPRFATFLRVRPPE